LFRDRPGRMAAGRRRLAVDRDSRRMNEATRRRSSRRSLSLGVAALAVAIAAGCSGPPPQVRASSAGIRIVRFTLTTTMVKPGLPEIGVVPPPRPSGARPPMLVFLHGRNGTPDSGLNAAITMIQDAGPLAPAIVLANGNRDSYWHDRRSGRWGTSI